MSVPVTGTISTTDPSDSYATIDPLSGIDGWRSVADHAARNAIATLRRRAGMIVWCQNTTGTDGVSGAYQLNPAPWAGTDADWTALSFAGGTGTVTSVALAMPGIFGVSGSPVTSSGTIAVSLATQSPNLVFAGPNSGSSATPTFRALVALDLPTVGLNVASHYGAVADDADGSTVTFDCGASDRHRVTLGGNRTLAVTGATVGQQITVILAQDGTGSRTVTWWTTIKWPSGTAPTLTTNANAVDVFTLLQVASNVWYGFPCGYDLFAAGGSRTGPVDP